MKVKVATSQFKAIKGDFDANLNKAISLVEKASNENVDILLLQELFQDYYFCSTKNDKFFDLAIDFPSHPIFEKLSNICKDKKISLPISFFQKKENKFFNSLVMIDSLGKISEVYNKSHIPEGPGYNEKYYFEKGNTGFEWARLSTLCIMARSADCYIRYLCYICFIDLKNVLCFVPYMGNCIVFSYFLS